MKGISSLPRVTAWLAVGDFIISSQSLTRCHMTPYHFPFLFSLSLTPPLSIAHLSSSSFFSSLLFFFLLLCSAHPNTEREIRESEIERWRGRSERVSWEQRDETERAERLRVRSGEMRETRWTREPNPILSEVRSSMSGGQNWNLAALVAVFGEPMTRMGAKPVQPERPSGRPRSIFWWVVASDPWDMISGFDSVSPLPLALTFA
jgi:hypothetical protein